MYCTAEQIQDMLQNVKCQRTWSAGCKRWAILRKTGLQFTPWIKRWSRRTL